LVVNTGRKDEKGLGRAVKPLLILGAALIALAACDTAIPDSGGGVGFDDYASYELDRARRDALLRGEPQDPALNQPGIVTPVAPQAGSPQPGVDSTALAAAGIGVQTDRDGVIDNSGDDGLRSAGVQASPGNAAPVLVGNAGISDEQDFDAVAERETIESDAARREQQAAAYQLVDAGALPERNGATGPNIVAYALDAPNELGQERYSRSLLSGQNRFIRNCSKYRSPDEAQRDFLSRGGPERDRLGIDPDGDGFACGWDPRPFRQAAAAAAGN